MNRYQSSALQLSPNSRDDPVLGLANDANLQLMPSLCGVPLKYISLIALAVQNSMLTIIMHYSRISNPPSQAYSAATAVLLNELLKGVISLAIAFFRIDSIPNSTSLDGTPSRTGHLGLLARFGRLGREVFAHDCWKLSIPAILYVIQNNLQFVAASNLDAATFQVSYQMKILTTATFSVLLLRKKLHPSQWLALLCLAIGVGIVQIQTTPATNSAPGATHQMHALKGFLAVAAACFTSGLAGVYFEMVLKNSSTDLWVRNVQLSLFSLLPALIPVIFTNKFGLVPGGFSMLFHNFGAWAWATVAVQVMGGLVTALVIKYSDNILKGFATSLSIVISFLASAALFDFRMTFTFLLGSGIVLIATWLYNSQPKLRRSRMGKTESLSIPWNRNEKDKGEVPASLIIRPPTPAESNARNLSTPSESVSSTSLSRSTSSSELCNVGHQREGRTSPSYYSR